MGIVISEFEEELQKVTGVMEIHDLHIWSLSVGKPALSAHVFSSEPGVTLREATKLCRRSIYYSNFIFKSIFFKKKDMVFIIRLFR
jgi:zinc transporter 2